MKKVIGILLSAVLLFSCLFSFGTSALASTSLDSPDVLELNSTVYVTVSDSISDSEGTSTGWAMFTPESDGLYMFTLYTLNINGVNYEPYVTLFDSLNDAKSRNYKNELNLVGIIQGNQDVSMECVYNLKAGVTYYAELLLFGELEAEIPVEITRHTHTLETGIFPAEFDHDGESSRVCSVCNAITSVKTIPRISKANLSTLTYTYNGQAKKPSVTVKDRKGATLKNGTDYTVTYASGRKNVGKYSVKIKFKGNYSGTKTLYFTIKPKATSISSLSAGSKKFTVKWKKQSTQVTGYQIQYSTSSKFSSPKTVTVSSYKTTSKTVKSLKAKKKYYVRVRTYKTVSGTKYCSSWSKAKSVTTKK